MWRVPRKRQGRAVKCASRPINSHRMKRCHFFFIYLFFLCRVDSSASSAPRPNLRRMPTTAALAHQTAKEKRGSSRFQKHNATTQKPHAALFLGLQLRPCIFFIWIHLDSCSILVFSGINRRKVLPLKLFFIFFWWQRVCLFLEGGCFSLMWTFCFRRRHKVRRKKVEVFKRGPATRLTNASHLPRVALETAPRLSRVKWRSRRRRRFFLCVSLQIQEKKKKKGLSWNI